MRQWSRPLLLQLFLTTSHSFPWYLPSGSGCTQQLSILHQSEIRDWERAVPEFNTSLWSDGNGWKIRGCETGGMISESCLWSPSQIATAPIIVSLHLNQPPVLWKSHVEGDAEWNGSKERTWNGDVTQDCELGQGQECTLTLSLIKL